MGVLIRTRLEILRIRELSKNQNETHIKIMSKNVTAHCVKIVAFFKKVSVFIIALT